MSSSVATSAAESAGSSPRLVTLGGGHGLYASLSALRPLDVDITAVVTVADDGGSSGRIRRELGVLPPGDLRMALAALVEPEPGLAEERADRGGSEGSAGSVGSPGPTGWPRLLQHRLGGTGVLAGHPIGNLVLTGLLELHEDPVRALDELGSIIGARGRVLPMSLNPLDLIAEVTSVDTDDPVRHRRIRGQSAIASTAGRVTSIRLVPPDAPACPEAVAAIEAADAVILGPGSWFTSVIPHLLVPELADALVRTSATRIVVLNLEQQAGETEGFSPEQHLEALREHCPGLRLDAVVADTDAVLDPHRLARYAEQVGCRLVLCPVAAEDAQARHDPVKLGAAIADAARLDRHTRSTQHRDDRRSTQHRDDSRSTGHRDDSRSTGQGAH